MIAVNVAKSIWKKCSWVLPDKLYLSLEFKKHMGFFPNFKNPKTFNEKLQWLKLYDRKPVYTTLVDKYEVKPYVEKIIGKEHIIPTLGVYDKFDDIDFDSLPNQFVIKCTHDSAGVIIVRNKSTFDKEKARKKIKKCLKTNFYYSGREWPYKNVKPRIIIEKYMEESDNKQTLYDYSVFFLNESAKCLKSDFEKFIEHQPQHYDRKKNAIIFGNVLLAPDNPNLLKDSKNLNDMIVFFEKLSSVSPLLKMDLYNQAKKQYIGETFIFRFSDLEKYIPEEWHFDQEIWLQLPDFIGGYICRTDNVLIYLKNSKNINKELLDYKFYCFNGKAKFLYVGKSNFIGGQKHDSLKYLDINWNETPFNRPDHLQISCEVPRPKKLDEMISIANRIAEGFAFCRVDLYDINDVIYFSEITLFPGSGFGAFEPPEWELEIGKWIHLPKDE